MMQQFSAYRRFHYGNDRGFRRFMNDRNNRAITFPQKRIGNRGRKRQPY